MLLTLTTTHRPAPVLDNDKHYWVGDDKVEKILRHGEGWLASHPEREAITRRYLKHQRSLVDDALAQLGDESEPDPDAAAEKRDAEETALEASLRSSRGTHHLSAKWTKRCSPHVRFRNLSFV